MLGCDIIEIDRIKLAVDKFGDKFVDKILSTAEKRIFNARAAKATFLAGRFAAKEAVAKAIGTGIGEQLGFTDIEILPDDAGKPMLYLFGELAKDAEVSISHSRGTAIAVCLISYED